MIGVSGLHFVSLLSRALNSSNLESKTRGSHALKGLIAFLGLHFVSFLSWLRHGCNHERKIDSSHHEMKIFLLVSYSHESTPLFLHLMDVLVSLKQHASGSHSACAHFIPDLGALPKVVLQVLLGMPMLQENKQIMINLKVVLTMKLNMQFF